MLAGKMIDGIPEEVNIAALVSGFGKHLTDSGSEPGVVVCNDVFDAVETTCLEGKEEVLPGRAALPVGHFDGKNLAATVPIDTDRDQHRLAHNDAGLAHLLVTSVEDEIREGLGEGAIGKGGEAFIQPLVDGGDRRGGEAVSAELFGDRLDFAGRDTLHI